MLPSRGQPLVGSSWVAFQTAPAAARAGAVRPFSRTAGWWRSPRAPFLATRRPPGVCEQLQRDGRKLAWTTSGPATRRSAYLKPFPPRRDQDRPILRERAQGADADDEAIVTSVVSLAPRPSASTVVAEGVETVEQLDALRALGVDQAQGFFWARADCPPTSFDEWLDARTAAPVPRARAGDLAAGDPGRTPSGGRRRAADPRPARGRAPRCTPSPRRSTPRRGRRTPARAGRHKTVARVVAGRLAPHLGEGTG